MPRKMDGARVGECIAKTRAFYETKTVGCALLKVKDIASLPSPALPLTDYAFPEDLHRYLDDRARRVILRLEQRRELPDDTVPAEGPWFGIAEHTAFLGGRVDYGADTSWHHPLLSSPGELRKLSADESNPMFRMVTEGIAYLRERYGGYFLPMVRGASGALEMANTLRGNGFFCDFYDEPEALKALLDFCAEALVRYYDKQLEAAGSVYGGVVTGFGEWLPGHALGHVSEDTAALISPEQFEEFGRPRTEGVYRRFDGVFLHMHALCERVLPSVSSLPNLLLMELSSDPNTDRAVEVWKRSRERLAPVIPVLRLTRPEIRANMELLKSQKTVVWYDASCMEDAQDMCALFARELPVR